MEEKFLFTKAELAKIFGISKQALDKWAIVPVKKDGKTDLFNISEVIQYRINRDTASSNDPKERYFKAMAAKAELEVSRQKGKVLEYTAVEKVVGDVLSKFKGSIIAIPARLSARVVGINNQQEALSMLQKEMEIVLNQLSTLNLEDAITVDTDFELVDLDKEDQEDE